MPQLDKIREIYRERADEGVPAKGAAAVAMVLREGADGLEALFIERAQRDGDPWSGQMAFPGGRWEPNDGALRYTAQRETLEELGIELAGMPYLGYLGEVSGRGRAVQVVGYAFLWEGERPEMVLSQDEVAAALWIPLRVLRDPLRFAHYRVPYAPDKDFNGILVDGRYGDVDEDRLGGPRVIWGLTLRFLREFHERLGFEFPVRPERVPVVGYRG